MCVHLRPDNTQWSSFKDTGLLVWVFFNIGLALLYLKFLEEKFTKGWILLFKQRVIQLWFLTCRQSWLFRMFSNQPSYLALCLQLFSSWLAVCKTKTIWLSDNLAKATPEKTEWVALFTKSKLLWGTLKEPFEANVVLGADAWTEAGVYECPCADKLRVIYS